MDGLRACITEEFSSLYVFNLRGNQRTSGEVSRQEGGKIFGSGARTPVAITLLVKNPAKKAPATIRYHDIGDYLSRKEKLAVIRRFNSVAGIEKAKQWTTLAPNSDHDWINQRDPGFQNFLPIGDKEDDTRTIFSLYSRGLATSRDSWCYNFSEAALASNMLNMAAFYTEQSSALEGQSESTEKKDALEIATEFVDTNAKKISWSRGLMPDLARGKVRPFNKAAIRPAAYRPFTKQWAYFDRAYNDMVYKLHVLFPTPKHDNLAICTTSAGNRRFVLRHDNGCPSRPSHVRQERRRANASHFTYTSPRRGRTSWIMAAATSSMHTTGGTPSRTVPSRRFARPTARREQRRHLLLRLRRAALARIPHPLRGGPEEDAAAHPADARNQGIISRSLRRRKLAEWHLNYETVPAWPVEEIHDQLELDLAETYKVRR